MGAWLRTILGGKPWYESMTIWAGITFTVANVAVVQLCAPEVAILSATVCGWLVKSMNMVGGWLALLGIRKAATAPNSG